MPKDEIFVGYQTNFPGTILPSKMLAVPVKISVFHMLIAGQTQMSGKTTTIKALIQQLVKLGYKVLIFDTKTQLSEFQDIGKEIPICLRETTDSLTILGLLESIMGRKISDKYATLNKVSENANSFEEVLENAEELMKTSRAGWVQDSARVLVDLMKRLIAQTKGKKTVSKLELPYAVNRITMNDFSLEGQQLIIKTAFEDALKIPGVVIILDESNKYLPQKYRSACQREIFNYVTQGAITKNFLWMSTQFLATTQKDVMKAMDVRLLGRQSHITECEHTLEYIPKLGLAQKINEDTIMQLKKGHFVLVSDNTARCVYITPPDGDPHDCQLVAMGKLAPEAIHYRFTIAGSYEEVADAKKAVQNVKKKPSQKSSEATEPLEETVINLSDESEIEEVVVEPEELEIARPLSIEERINNIEKTIADVNKIVEKVAMIIKPQGPTVQSGQEITIAEVHTKVKVTPEVKTLPPVTTKDNRGKILMLAKEGFFAAWHPLRDVVNAFENHNWTVEYANVKHELLSLAEEQILTVKKSAKRENVYKLGAYIQFEESK